eukprot:CAMPEP_0118822086 /NCGR_PEP_ID=MMETSP1162-20130426/8932_1 /TAXON_ID=33656 /ORGANISM="Phaeocystis Sp, Strain CCMP2710" /LENGTH=94 /DNA_ID=CAMNT_0006752601 /DNA_START=3 /DNA_END=284 /DNA_ORIENTATION=+
MAISAQMATSARSPSAPASLSARLGRDAFEVCLSQLGLAEMHVAMAVSRGWRASARQLLNSPAYLASRYTLRQLLLLLRLRDEEEEEDDDDDDD